MNVSGIAALQHEFLTAYDLAQMDLNLYLNSCLIKGEDLDMQEVARLQKESVVLRNQIAEQLFRLEGLDR